MSYIPTDLSAKNYTFENWTKMGAALCEIKAMAEKGAVGEEAAAQEILTRIAKLEKAVGMKFSG